MGSLLCSVFAIDFLAKMFGLMRRSVKDLRVIANTVNRLNAQRGMMTGFGGRSEQNKTPQGLTVKSLKHHYALIPLAVIMGAGMIFVGAFCVRLAVYSPETNWSRRDTDEIVNYYANKRHIFYDPMNKDYDEHARMRPDYSK